MFALLLSLALSDVSFTPVSFQGQTVTEQIRQDAFQVSIQKCVFKDITVNDFGGAIYIRAETAFSAQSTAFLRCQSMHGGAAALVLAGSASTGTASFQKCLFQDCAVTQYDSTQVEAFGFGYPVFGAVVAAYATGMASMQSCVFKNCETTGLLVTGVCGLTQSVLQSCKFENCTKMKGGWLLGVGPGTTYQDICYEGISSSAGTGGSTRVAMMDVKIGSTTSITLRAAGSSALGNCRNDAYTEVEKLDPDYKESIIPENPSTGPIIGIVIGVLVVIGVVAFFVRRRIKAKKEQNAAEQPEA